MLQAKECHYKQVLTGREGGGGGVRGGQRSMLYEE